MAGPRIGARKERPLLRGTADGGAVEPVLGASEDEGASEDAGASRESPEAWEGLQGSSP